MRIMRECWALGLSSLWSPREPLERLAPKVIRGIEAHSRSEHLLAELLFTEAILRNPTISELYVRRASARLAMGDNRGALADFRITRRLDPDSITDEIRALIHAILADKARDKGELEKAIELANRAAQLNEDEYRYALLEASLSLQQGTAEGSDKFYRLRLEQFKALKKEKLLENEAIERLNTLIANEKSFAALFHFEDDDSDVLKFMAGPLDGDQLREDCFVGYISSLDALSELFSSLEEYAAKALKVYCKALDTAEKGSEDLLGHSLGVDFFFASKKLLQYGPSAAKSCLISTAAQDYLAVWESNVDLHSVLLIEEPHWDVEQHIRLAHGLNHFFAENAGAAKEAVMLAEGYPANEPIDTTSLGEASAYPSENEIRATLAHHLITGYIAYIWATNKREYAPELCLSPPPLFSEDYSSNIQRRALSQNDSPRIKIVGHEDLNLHAIAAKLWPHTGSCTVADELWRRAVYARNISSANVVRRYVEQGSLVLMFIGSLHHKINRKLRRISRSAKKIALKYVSQDELDLLASSECKGLLELLQEN